MQRLQFPPLVPPSPGPGPGPVPRRGRRRRRRSLDLPHTEQVRPRVRPGGHGDVCRRPALPVPQPGVGPHPAEDVGDVLPRVRVRRRHMEGRRVICSAESVSGPLQLQY